MELKHVIDVKEIKVKDKLILGIKIDLPGAPLVVLRGEKGFVMCGYLNMNVVNKLGVIAVKASGVKSIEDILEKNAEEVSNKALEVGIKCGMKIKEILDKIS